MRWKVAGSVQRRGDESELHRMFHSASEPHVFELFWWEWLHTMKHSYNPVLSDSWGVGSHIRGIYGIGHLVIGRRAEDRAKI